MARFKANRYTEHCARVYKHTYVEITNADILVHMYAYFALITKLLGNVHWNKRAVERHILHYVLMGLFLS
jgi:hypothetical protein